MKSAYKVPANYIGALNIVKVHKLPTLHSPIYQPSCLCVFNLFVHAVLISLWLGTRQALYEMLVLSRTEIIPYKH